jgi:type I restriction enzyme S subunit
MISGVGRAEQWSSVTGTTVYGVSADALKSTRILVPPVNEQIAISNHIRKSTTGVEHVESLLRAQTEKLGEYRQALISAAATGKLDISKEAV